MIFIEDHKKDYVHFIMTGDETDVD
ncbi:DUF5049 domain-containing protein [Enterococcus faecium]|nr:DUF5049 domain-containing protein [Enterococcus faecium]MDB7377849.1 DUF5049 domain-containing protein [Enterococcus faecium]MDB7380450.1 DUF5049 domain-containing protein [Enterococcus faecium]MDB7385572.1 DUF5049 domain-containing protein [Enterococcus faecium]MDB7388079.1 DUF5049 domain-containing protein [Enterococcus faecium]